MASRIVFAANATFGNGGQGEFLRLMTHALKSEADATIYSRSVPAGYGHTVNLHFAGSRRAKLFNALLRVPVLRGRSDWLTLLSDLDFDEQLALALGLADADAANHDPPALFDGVMAQCANTVAGLRRGATRVVITSLNTHIRNLTRVMDAEYQRVGAGDHSFVHPDMVARALREIDAADHIRVNSQLAKGTFIEAGVESAKVTAIYPGIDLDHFVPVEKTDDVFRVLAIASIDPRKGIHDLLTAFDDARLPNAELVIIGGTGDRWSKRLIERYRSRLPNLSCRAVDIMTTPVAETFGRASVLVHAAVEDGFGLVVPQALASGRPVIVTRSSGAAELVDHGRNGFVVSPQSPAEMAAHLKTLAHDAALWRSMCDASRPSVANLTYERFATETRSLYARVLSGA